MGIEIKQTNDLTQFKWSNFKCTKVFRRHDKVSWMKPKTTDQNLFQCRVKTHSVWKNLSIYIVLKSIYLKKFETNWWKVLPNNHILQIKLKKSWWKLTRKTYQRTCRPANEVVRSWIIISTQRISYLKEVPAHGTSSFHHCGHRDTTSNKLVCMTQNSCH